MLRMWRVRRLVVTFAMVPAGVAASAALEAGLAAESAGLASGVAAAFTPPAMAPDLDSAKFALHAAAAGQEHVAVAQQHAASRGLYSGAQSLAMMDTVATEAIRAAATSI
jgi:hypothetical protein